MGSLAVLAQAWVQLMTAAITHASRGETSPAAKRGRGSLIAAVIAYLIFGLLFALVRSRRSAAFDTKATLAVQRSRTPARDRIMRIVSWPGYSPQSRLIPPVIAGALWLRGCRREAIFQGLAWGASFLSFFVKLVMRRDRPAHPTVYVDPAKLGGTSFPSGHVLNYVGVYGFLAYLVHRYVAPAPLRRLLVGGLTGLIALVGPSRIYLGHHWLTDVLASYFLGSGYLLTVIGLYRRAKFWGKRA